MLEAVIVQQTAVMSELAATVRTAAAVGELHGAKDAALRELLGPDHDHRTIWHLQRVAGLM